MKDYNINNWPNHIVNLYRHYLNKYEEHFDDLDDEGVVFCSCLYVNCHIINSDLVTNPLNLFSKSYLCIDEDGEVYLTDASHFFEKYGNLQLEEGREIVDLLKELDQIGKDVSIGWFSTVIERACQAHQIVYSEELSIKLTNYIIGRLLRNAMFAIWNSELYKSISGDAKNLLAFEKEDLPEDRRCGYLYEFYNRAYTATKELFAFDLLKDFYPEQEWKKFEKVVSSPMFQVFPLLQLEELRKSENRGGREAAYKKLNKKILTGVSDLVFPVNPSKSKNERILFLYEVFREFIPSEFPSDVTLRNQLERDYSKVTKIMIREKKLSKVKYLYL